MAPSVSIFGSFFPAWLISAVVGLLLTVVARQALVATGAAPLMRPAGLAYASLACLLVFAVRLFLFRG
jgi:hypothetical protein